MMDIRVKTGRSGRRS